MKKYYYFVFAFLVLSTITFAQQYQYASKGDAVRHIIRPENRGHQVQHQIRNTQVTYFIEDFEAADLATAGWTTIDADGDTYDWSIAGVGAHGGAQCATSASWIAGVGPVTPDNWLISPAIDLTGASGTIFLEWYVRAQDQTWPSEVYRVLLSTSGTAISDFTEIYPDETVQPNGPDGNFYWKRTVDISAYAGQTVHIAFEHHNVTDMFRINIDDVSVYQNTVIDAGLTEIVAPNNNSGCTLSNAEPVTVRIFNYGGNPLTDFDVSYSINGGTPVVEHVTGVNIAPSTSYDYTFTQTADLSNLGYYVINANINLTNDSDGSNNTASTNVTSGDAVISVEVQSDDQYGQYWEIVDSDGDVIASHDVYQWNVDVTTDVCVIANDCYTFNWVYTGSGTNTVTVSYNGTQLNQTTATDSFSVYAIGDNCSAIDANLVSLDFPGYTMPNTDVDIKGTVRNVGTDPITSFDVDYSIDGGPSVGTYSVTGLNLATGDSYQFTHNVPFNQSVEAIYSITVTVSNVNGGTDGNPANNTLTQNINVTSSQIQRNVLIEQFTTEECPNCPPVLQYLEGLFDNDDHAIMVAHHAGYYTDFLTTQTDTDMLDFFNDGGATYAPAGMFDRSYNGQDNDGYDGPDPGPVFWDGDPYGGTRLADREATPAFVDVSITGTYDQNTHQLNCTVSGSFYDNLSDMGVGLFITEDHIAAQNQAGASGNFEHRYAFRGTASDRLGDPITTSTNVGDTFSKNFTYTMDASWDYNNLYLVAFVAHLNASDVNDREIANAVQVKLTDLQPGAVGELDRAAVKIFPNPTSGLLYLKGAKDSSLKIYDLLGQVVVEKDLTSDNETVDLTPFHKGMYFVKLIKGNSFVIKKINLK